MDVRLKHISGQAAAILSLMDDKNAKWEASVRTLLGDLSTSFDAAGLNADRLADAVLLNISTLTERDNNNFSGKWSFCDVFKQALAKVEKPGRNGVLKTTTEFGNIPEIISDSQKITRIVALILKHIATVSPNKNVVVRAAFMPEDQKSGILIVKFSGSGISRHSRDFVRYAAPESGTVGSLLGLDLLLAKAIATSLDGEMLLEHQNDSITVEIPVLTISDITEKSPAEARPQCLLVDDIDMNLKILQAMVKKCNCESITAHSGCDALALCAKHRFSYILTDLWMPEMNGEELARKIRKDPALSDIPIVAVTADVDHADNFKMDCFDTVILKPVNLQKLKSIIK